MRSNAKYGKSVPFVSLAKGQGEIIGVDRQVFIPDMTQLCKQCWMPYCGCNPDKKETIKQMEERYAKQGHSRGRRSDGSIVVFTSKTSAIERFRNASH